MVDPVISFVVPCRNEKGFIKDCLDSIDSQCVSHEIIAVDGGSEDGTLEIVEDRADKVLENIDGIGQARHSGALIADGSFLAFIDADTILRPDYSEKMVSFVEAEQLAAASSKFSITGFRSQVVRITCEYWLMNRQKCLLPGFNTFAVREKYLESEGFRGRTGRRSPVL